MKKAFITVLAAVLSMALCSCTGVPVDVSAPEGTAGISLPEYSATEQSVSFLTLTGNYVEIQTEGNRGDFYVMDYLMMDCCREWSRICKLCMSFHGANAVEGIEFVLYDSDAEEVKNREMSVTVTPSVGFTEKEYDSLKVVNFHTLVWYEATEKDGRVSFTTDTPGIYLLVKYGEGEMWLTNPADCNGECRTCSDEW